jgi:hypothetical protein
MYEKETLWTYNMVPMILLKQHALTRVKKRVSYLALKSLLSATRRILDEGDERSRESVQPAKRLRQTQ